jgi:hypothetical protein
MEAPRLRFRSLRNLKGIPLPARRDGRISRKFNTAARSRLNNRHLSSPGMDSKHF